MIAVFVVLQFLLLSLLNEINLFSSSLASYVDKWFVVLVVNNGFVSVSI